MKQQRGCLAHTQIVNVVHLAHLDGIQHHRFPQAGLLRYLLLHAGIHFLPKAGNAAHQRGAYFLDSGLDICRTEVDAHLYSPVDAEIGPGLLKHMRQREEVHGHVFIRHGSQADVVDADGFPVVEVMQHHPFRFAGGAGGIKDIGKVLVRSACGTFFHNIVMGQVFAQCEELIIIDGCLVAGVEHYVAVENNQFLQGVAEAERTEGGVILELLAYEEEAYLCVVNDVLRLCRRAGGIQRYSDQTIGESCKIGEQTFRFIL